MAWHSVSALNGQDRRPGRTAWPQIASVVFGLPIVILKLDRQKNHEECKLAYAWVTTGGTLGFCKMFFTIASMPASTDGAVRREVASLIMSTFVSMCIVSEHSYSSSLGVSSKSKESEVPATVG